MIVEPSGVRFTASRNKTVLQSALDAGIDWPYRCRVGACATCKCRLTAGRVLPLIDFAYALSSEDLQNNFILACKSRPISDLQIELTRIKRRSDADGEPG